MQLRLEGQKGVEEVEASRASLGEGGTQGGGGLGGSGEGLRVRSVEEALEGQKGSDLSNASRKEGGDPVWRRPWRVRRGSKRTCSLASLKTLKL